MKLDAEPVQVKAARAWMKKMPRSYQKMGAVLTAFVKGAEWQRRQKIEITDEMVQRGADTSSTGRQNDPAYLARVRRVLEAALNG